MTLIEMHREAIDNLSASKRMVQQLSVFCPDWAANEMLRIDFDQLEKSLDEYGRHQLGLIERHSGGKCEVR